MCIRDSRETLNRIRQQADAATEGSWMGVCDSDGYLGRVIGPDGFGIAEDFRDDADAEFTAAARTTVPRLVDALQAVLELHKPGRTFHGHGFSQPLCTCGAAMPCPTVAAIRQHIGDDL